jgi:hypothetical protein
LTAKWGGGPFCLKNHGLIKDHQPTGKEIVIKHIKGIYTLMCNFAENKGERNLFSSACFCRCEYHAPVLQ